MEMKQKKRVAIVVAGGKGLRMGRELPKQFICLNGKPVLMHTLERFAGLVQELVLVLPKDHFAYWTELVDKYDFKLPHRLVEGGATRFHSVQNAVQSLQATEPCLVAIHDGVRPMVSEKLIEELFSSAEQCGAVLPTIAVVDSLREVKEGSSRAVSRADYRAVQTPQVFDLGLIAKAYKSDYQDFFTDDASVFEHCYDQAIQLVQGEEQNIKITHEQDLILAEYFLQENKS